MVKIMKYNMLVAVFTVLLLPVLVLAQDPSPPMNVEGLIQIDGQNVVDGLTLDIKIDGVVARTIVVVESKYNVDLLGGIDGTAVTFFLEGQEANEQTIYESGKGKLVDLTFDPFCGDRVCSNGETAVTCATDCAAVCGNNLREGTEQCDGTDLASQTCVLKGFASGTLKCSATCTFDTSSCVAKTITTTTSSGGGGGGSNKGATDVTPLVTSDNTVGTKTENKPVETTPSETSNNVEGSSITGAFAGLITPTNMVIAASAVALVGGAAYFYISRKKSPF